MVGVLAAALLLLNFASPEAFLAIGTTCIVLLCLAYAMVTGPALVARLRGRFTTAGTDETGASRFPLGRWGVPLNAVALLYGLAITVNLACQRAAVYDPAGGHWYFQWFTVLFLAVTVGLGCLYRQGPGVRPRCPGSW